MAPTNEKVVIIIPTYNERGNIDRLIPVLTQDIFPKVPQNFDMHILVVDDNSPDKTAVEVEKLSKKYKNVHLLLNPQKSGLGKAYMKGMKHAINELKADIVFQFDADFSHDPQKIAPMLKKLSEGNDLVLGARYVKGGSIPDNWGFHRKFLSVVGNFVIRTVITHFAIHDWTTGYRAIRKDVVNHILPKLDNDRFTGYTFQIGFLHQTLRAGYKIAEVPINFVDRTLGKSKLGAEYIKNTLLFIVKVRLSEIFQHRIFRFLIVGGIGAFVQLLSLSSLRQLFTYQLAFFLSIELAVVSNFILSNIFTFSDRQLKTSQIPFKFIQFNLASAGSILIQQLTAFLGEKFIGLKPVFTTPLIPIEVDTGMLYAVFGILIGMMWNFFAYSTLIWRKKTK